jgi:nitroreductase
MQEQLSHRRIVMMTFTELLKNRRAIRDFQDKEVPLKIVEEILTGIMLAPSASNGQPCRFTIVNCKNTINGAF